MVISDSDFYFYSDSYSHFYCIFVFFLFFLFFLLWLSGYSAWQTVSVQFVDEEEEAMLREEELLRSREELRLQAIGSLTKVDSRIKIQDLRFCCIV